MVKRLDSPTCRLGVYWTSPVQAQGGRLAKPAGQTLSRSVDLGQDVVLVSVQSLDHSCMITVRARRRDRHYCSVQASGPRPDGTIRTGQLSGTKSWTSAFLQRKPWTSRSPRVCAVSRSLLHDHRASATKRQTLLLRPSIWTRPDGTDSCPGRAWTKLLDLCVNLGQTRVSNTSRHTKHNPAVSHPFQECMTLVQRPCLFTWTKPSWTSILDKGLIYTLACPGFLL